MAICTKPIEFGSIGCFWKHNTPTDTKAEPTSIFNAEDKELTLKDYQKARRIADHCIFKSYEEIKEHINNEKDLKKKALLIVHIIESASRGWGTDDNAFAAAIYSISKDDYELVEYYMKKVGHTYKGTGIENYILEETSGDEQKDYLRHINQFKNKRGKIV